MLDAIGARRPDDQEDDLGFVYCCRHFRNDEPRSVPVPTSLVPSEGTSLLTFPGDADTYSLTFYVASNDHDLRGLRTSAPGSARWPCSPTSCRYGRRPPRSRTSR
jgi:hypothetical protein